MSDIIITPASGKIDFYQDLGAASLAKIELTPANDLSLSTTSGNLIIGDASRDIYIGNGINDVDIVFEQNGEIRPLPAKTLNIGTSGSFTQILASKVNINQNSFTNIPLDVYSSTSGATILNVAGTKGALFSVTDNLSGSLMSVNNDAGLPVFEVFSDDRVVAGRFNQNDFVMTSGGNVGIGTGVPSSKFHVIGTSTFNGDVSSTGSFIAGSGSAALPSFEFINDVDTGLFSPAANTFGVSTSGVERLRVDSVGRVGIGATSPTSTLQVSGLITANSGNFTNSLSSAGNNRFYYNGDNVNNEFTIYSTTLANAGLANKFKIIPSGTNYGTSVTLISNPNSSNQIIYLPTYNDGTLALTSDINTTQITGVLSASKGGTNTSTYSNGQLLIGSGTSLVANTLTQNNGITITNGSGTIGIAVDSTVVRTTGTQSINGLKSFNSNAQFGTGDQAVFNLGDNLAVGGSGAGLFDASTPVAAELWSGTSSIIHYAYGGGTLSSPRIAVLESNGNVGIGTNSPTSKLHVAGDVLATGSFIAGSGSAANPSFEFTGDPDTGLFSPASNTIALATSGVERFRIGNNGNIGINYSAPTTTLQVNGSFSCGYGGDPSVGGQGLYLDPLVPSLIFNDSSGPNTTVTINNDGLTLHDFTSAAFFYTDRNNARIGIGTSTPYYTLHVEGAASFNSINSDWNSMDNDYWIQTDGAGSISAQQLLLGYLGPGNGRQASISCNYYSPLSISNTNSQPIIFNLDSSEKFRISNSGIGINTNNPTYQLHVNGSGIIASGLQVNGSLSLNGSGVGLYDTSVFNLGTISGTNAINCGQDRQIQNLTLNGGATTFTKGTGWPSSNSVARETTLNIFASGNTSVTWTIVNDWYRQPDSPLPSGRHIVLLRSVGSGTMQGHYIGNKTN